MPIFETLKAGVTAQFSSIEASTAIFYDWQLPVNGDNSGVRHAVTLQVHKLSAARKYVNSVIEYVKKIRMYSTKPNVEGV